MKVLYESVRKRLHHNTCMEVEWFYSYYLTHRGQDKMAVVFAADYFICILIYENF